MLHIAIGLPDCVHSVDFQALQGRHPHFSEIFLRNRVIGLPFLLQLLQLELLGEHVCDLVHKRVAVIHQKIPHQPELQSELVEQVVELALVRDEHRRQVKIVLGGFQQLFVEVEMLLCEGGVDCPGSLLYLSLSLQVSEVYVGDHTDLRLVLAYVLVRQ